MHKSGAEKLGLVPSDKRNKPLDEIQKDTTIVPQGCVVMEDFSIWRPHYYKVQINHYKRLKKAYEDMGMEGVKKYLEDIKKIQQERAEKFKKDQELKAAIINKEAPKVEAKGGLQEYVDGVRVEKIVIDKKEFYDQATKQSNKEASNSDTLGDG